METARASVSPISKDHGANTVLTPTNTAHSVTEVHIYFTISSLHRVWEYCRCLVTIFLCVPPNTSLWMHTRRV